MGDANKVLEEPIDVVIVGAGISGINAAYRLQTELPSATYTILESRGNIGGTWDFFRYPGFRSDSDLYTFGFEWRPWKELNAIADGESIRKYICESAALYGIDRKVQFHHKLISANWSSDQQAWTLLIDEDGKRTYFHTRFVVLSTGYYDYDEPLSSAITGIDNFQGTLVHPQFWPEELDYKDKKIVVVGSGSTAVTLIPTLAETASHVIMLQRSPGYILAIPKIDGFGEWAHKLFPSRIAHRITRFKFLVITFLLIKICAFFPLFARHVLKKATIKQLPENVPYEPPHYNPLEQRLCLCPDGDFFKAMRAGKASVVTGTIATVTETGILLASSQKLDADIIITATGLKIKAAGGAHISVDNVPITISQKHLWKGCMLEDVPNMAAVIGYTDASWTLGADATALLVCRLLNFMRDKGFTAAVPRLEHTEGMKSLPALNITSTYVKRGMGELPRTGNKAPWLPRSTYVSDLWDAKFGNITHGLQLEKIST